MASKTLIGGTAYMIQRGKTLIGGTGYSIGKGRTLVGGTGYDIRLYPFGFTRWSKQGSHPPSGGFTFAYSETDSEFRAEIDGTPTGTDTQGENRGSAGYTFYFGAGDTVAITFSGKSGKANADVEVFNGPTIVNGWVSPTNVTTTFTATDSGQVLVRATNGSTSVSSMWVSITKIAINGTQVFPVQ